VLPLLGLLGVNLARGDLAELAGEIAEASNAVSSTP